MRRIGGTQHQFLVIQQIDQAGIALGELDHQGNNTLQHFLQAHFADHEPADLLKKAQLILGTLQARLEVFGFRHALIIAAGGSPARIFPNCSAQEVRFGIELTCRR